MTTIDPTTPAPVTITLPPTMTVDVRGTALTVNLAAMAATGALLNRAAYGVRKTIQDAHANAAYDTTEAMIRDGLWSDVQIPKDAKPAQVKPIVVAALVRAKAHPQYATRLQSTAEAMAAKAIASLTAPDWTGDDPFPIVLTGRDRALSDVLTARKIAHGATSAERATFITRVWASYDAGTAKPAAMDLCTEALNATTAPTIGADDLI